MAALDVSALPDGSPLPFADCPSAGVLAFPLPEYHQTVTTGKWAINALRVSCAVVFGMSAESMPDLSTTATFSEFLARNRPRARHFSIARRLAWRNITRDRVRLVIAVTGVAFAVLLMTVQL